MAAGCSVRCSFYSDYTPIDFQLGFEEILRIFLSPGSSCTETKLPQGVQSVHTISSPPQATPVAFGADFSTSGASGSEAAHVPSRFLAFEWNTSSGLHSISGVVTTSPNTKETYSTLPILSVAHFMEGNSMGTAKFRSIEVFGGGMGFIWHGVQ